MQCFKGWMKGNILNTTVNEEPLKNTLNLLNQFPVFVHIWSLIIVGHGKFSSLKIPLKYLSIKCDHKQYL